MKPIFYILNEDKEPVAADMSTFGLFFNDISKRKVKCTQIGSYCVSTVFLGIDHSYDSGIPLLFETMVFNDDGKNVDFDPQTDAQKASEILLGEDIFGNCRRYATWSGAEDGHDEIVRLITSVTGEDPVDVDHVKSLSSENKTDNDKDEDNNESSEESSVDSDDSSSSTQ